MLSAVASPPPSASTPREVKSDGVVGEVIRELHAMAPPRTVAAAAAVGCYIVAQLFGGDLARMREKGTRDSRLHALVNSPSLPFSQPVLWRCFGIYEMVQEDPTLSTSPFLGVTHLRAVIGLPSEARRRLLRLAESERWTAETLVSMAAAERVSEPRGCRSSKALLQRTVRLAERAAGDAAALRSAATVDGICASAVQQARERLVRAERALGALRQELDQRIADTNEAEDSAR